MIKSLLHWECISILSECVYAKFHPIDFRKSHDTYSEKTAILRQILADLYFTLRRRERREPGERGKERVV